ncbi:15.4 kDa class V heat shock protein [Linum grandiflorum]
MDFSPYHSSPWQYLIASVSRSSAVQANHVNWTQNPDSHVFSADIPDIRVEVENSRYVIIRTDGTNIPPERTFMRKFRLPDLVDVDGISAAYEDGVLKVTVPRASRRRGVFIQPADLPERSDRLAPAA